MSVSSDGERGTGAGAQPPALGLSLRERSEKSVLVESHKMRLNRMASGVIEAARGNQQEMTEGGFRFRVAFITATYRPGAEWSPRDISSLVTNYRKWAERRGFKLRYVWVMELQERGAPHYHLLLWLPRGYTPPMPDKQGWWRKGSTNAKWVRSAVGYIAKYASKGVHGDLPKGGRLWGYGGLGDGAQAMLSWVLSPSWLRSFVEQGTKVVKQAGGWWCAGGIRYRSPWQMASFGVGWVKLRWVGWSYDDIEVV